MDDLITFTASDARQNFYSLLRKAGKGLNSYEINLRGSKPVVLISKEELEGWIETMDIMSNPDEVRAIREAADDKKTVSFEKLLRDLEIKDSDEKRHIQKKSRKRFS